MSMCMPKRLCASYSEQPNVYGWEGNVRVKKTDENLGTIKICGPSMSIFFELLGGICVVNEVGSTARLRRPELATVSSWDCVPNQRTGLLLLPSQSLSAKHASKFWKKNTQGHEIKASVEIYRIHSTPLVQKNPKIKSTQENLPD